MPILKHQGIKNKLKGAKRVFGLCGPQVNMIASESVYPFPIFNFPKSSNIDLAKEYIRRRAKERYLFSFEESELIANDAGADGVMVFLRSVRRDKMVFDGDEDDREGHLESVNDPICYMEMHSVPVAYKTNTPITRLVIICRDLFLWIKSDGVFDMNGEKVTL